MTAGRQFVCVCVWVCVGDSGSSLTRILGAFLYVRDSYVCLLQSIMQLLLKFPGTSVMKSLAIGLFKWERKRGNLAGSTYPFCERG